jgi:PKD repeat protein
VAGFGFYPNDPSTFDAVQFFDFSYDPGGLGIASQDWHFGDGATGSGCCPTHTYAAERSYTAELTVTTPDGRVASTSQTVVVQTHDVAITKFSAPTAASAGQTRRITVGVNSKRYPETVVVQLFKGLPGSVPGGFEFLSSLTLAVLVQGTNRTTDFTFSYTFSAADAQLGKVTFRAVAYIGGARDALPADNEAIAPPTKVNR